MKELWKNYERIMRELWELWEWLSFSKSPMGKYGKIWENYENDNHSQKDSLEITRRREGHAQKDEKPVKTIEESIGTRMSNECDTQKPVKTIVFNGKREGHAHKDQKPWNTNVLGLKHKCIRIETQRPKTCDTNHNLMWQKSHTKSKNLRMITILIFKQRPKTCEYYSIQSEGRTGMP